MNAAGGDSDERITGANRLSVNEPIPIHRAHCESRKIVVVPGVHSGHLGGFSAEQRTSGLHTACADSRNHRFQLRGRKFSAGEIIEEKQWFCPLHEDVIDAHRHKVNADGVVLSEFMRDLELGAHAVRTGHQHGLPKAFEIKLEQPAKAADAAQHFRSHRSLDEGLEPGHALVGGLQAHSGGTVSVTHQNLHQSFNNGTSRSC